MSLESVKNAKLFIAPVYCKSKTLTDEGYFGKRLSSAALTFCIKKGTPENTLQFLTYFPK